MLQYSAVRAQLRRPSTTSRVKGKKVTTRLCAPVALSMLFSSLVAADFLPIQEQGVSTSFTTHKTALLSGLAFPETPVPFENATATPDIQTTYFQESSTHLPLGVEKPDFGESSLMDEHQCSRSFGVNEDFHRYQNIGHTLPISNETIVHQPTAHRYVYSEQTLEKNESTYVGETQFQDDTNMPVAGPCFYSHTGGVESARANTLVYSGALSQDKSTGFQNSDRRPVIEAGLVKNSFDVSTPNNVSTPNTMFADPEGIDGISTRAELPIWKNHLFSWSIGGSYLDVSRFISDEHDHIASNISNISNISDKENRVWGLGSHINAFRNRVSVNVEWAQSWSSQPVLATAFDSGPERQELPNSTLHTADFKDDSYMSGSAWRYAMNLALISAPLAESAPLSSSADLELLMEESSTEFNSQHGNTIPGRKHWKARLEGHSGPVFYEIGSSSSHDTSIDNGYNPQTSESTTMASINIDTEQWKSPVWPVHLMETMEMQDPIENQDTINQGTTFNSVLGGLIPSDVTLHAHVHSQETESIVDLPFATNETHRIVDLQTSRSLGLIGYWQHTNHVTSLEANLALHDIKTEYETTTQRDHYVALSEDIYIGKLTLGTRLGITQSEVSGSSWQSRSVEYDWSVSGSYTACDGMSFALAYDTINGSMKEYSFDDTESSQNQGFSLSIEMGQWLFRRSHLSRPPVFNVSWASSLSKQHSSYFSDRYKDQTFNINVGLQF